jgi:hypothetical protein
MFNVGVLNVLWRILSGEKLKDNDPKIKKLVRVRQKSQLTGDDQ